MRVTPTRVPDGQVAFQTAMPPDHRTSFTGSGLPFPSFEHAFNPCQSGYAVRAAGGLFDLPVRPPNSYVEASGRLSAPKARLVYTVLGERVDEWVPIAGVPAVRHRTLTHNVHRTSPNYYDSRGRLQTRSQERILRESAYGHASDPEVDFGWGVRPRV
jgi:hypothetical protein